MVDEEKRKAIMECHRPSTPSSIDSPLHEHKQGKGTFTWKPGLETSVTTIKDHACNAALLQLPDFSYSFDPGRDGHFRVIKKLGPNAYQPDFLQGPYYDNSRTICGQVEESDSLKIGIASKEVPSNTIVRKLSSLRAFGKTDISDATVGVRRPTSTTFEDLFKGYNIVVYMKIRTQE